MSTQDWKWPPTEPPYENDGCFAVTSPTKGPLLVAVRDNPKTAPVERDSNVAFAHIAMMYHDRLVEALTTLTTTRSSTKRQKAIDLINEIAVASMRRNR